jgi:hypothetical protein
MYNRLFTKILDSSIWLEEDVTRIVWITMLAAMDEDGFCPFSCDENLARRANVPTEKLVHALKVLESPDQRSPNDEFDGRRIERVPNGWMVLKAPYYRTMLSREIQRERTRLRVAQHRTKNKNVTDEALWNVTDVTVTNVTHSEADAEAKEKEVVQEKENSSSKWIEELKTDPAYKGIDVEREHAKCVRWSKEHKVQPTRRRFINWLNRSDKPLFERKFKDDDKIHKYGLPL